jgi:hypothetical protein
MIRPLDLCEWNYGFSGDVLIDIRLPKKGQRNVLITSALPCQLNIP